MNNWKKVIIRLRNGSKIKLENSKLQIRYDNVYCFENDKGEGNCIPSKNIKLLILRGE